MVSTKIMGTCAAVNAITTPVNSFPVVNIVKAVNKTVRITADPAASPPDNSIFI